MSFLGERNILSYNYCLYSCGSGFAPNDGNAGSRRVTKMTKTKLDVQQLKIGMYVRELDRPWRETSFLFQGFEISSEDEIRELQRFCQHVYIDIPETYQKSAPRTPAERAVTEELLQLLEAPRRRLARRARGRVGAPARVRRHVAALDGARERA